MKDYIGDAIADMVLKFGILETVRQLQDYSAGIHKWYSLLVHHRGMKWDFRDAISLQAAQAEASLRARKLMGIE